MKLTKHLTLALIVAGLLVSGLSVTAKPAKSKKDREIIEQLQKGLPVHMPVRAAAIVKQAAPGERKELAKSVLTHSIALKPQLAPSFVSSLVQVAPEAREELVRLATVQAPAQQEAISLAGRVSSTQIASASSGEVSGAFVSNVKRTKAQTQPQTGSPSSSKPGDKPPSEPTKDIGPQNYKTTGISQGGKFTKRIN